MYQRIELIGHLGKDVEVKTFDGGKKKVSFSVATSESYKDKSGQRVEQVEWHNVTGWNAVAHVAEKLLQKGSLVFIVGKLKTRSWESQSGEKKYITEIVADHITLLGGGRTQSAQSNQTNQTGTPWD